MLLEHCFLAKLAYLYSTLFIGDPEDGLIKAKKKVGRGSQKIGDRS